jgi:hypothetical protein
LFARQKPQGHSHQLPTPWGFCSIQRLVRG